MSYKCSICKDLGYWESNNQTLYCPACNKAKANAQFDYGIEGWVTSRWISFPAKYHQNYRFQTKPWLVVIHSGAQSAGVAEFFHRTGYVVTKDKRQIKVNAHLNWSITYDDFVQSVALDTVGMHCGGSILNNNKRLNFCSIGIELPGPVGQQYPEHVYLKFRATIVYLLEIVPSITTLVRHSDIDRHKTDPGKGFQWWWVEDLGLELPFRK